MPERRTYLLMIKYNNYDGVGSGDGSNRIAVVDPNAVQTDAISGLPIMREVATILGPTFESGTSGPVKEWCINTAAVDPLTGSVLVNSEDGVLYRWDLASNRYSQRIRLTSGLGEAYTPSVIGADGAVYAVNNATPLLGRKIGGQPRALAPAGRACRPARPLQGIPTYNEGPHRHRVDERAERRSALPLRRFRRHARSRGIGGTGQGQRRRVVGADRS
jgi:hypothetical protein